jgi:predicted dehydrogenase
MLKVGIIGAGRYVENRILPAFNLVNDASVVALCRRDASELARISKAFSIQASYQDAEELLGNGDVDLVWICSPNTLHFEHAKLAINAGKTVVVEKPFTATSDEGLSLEKLASENNIALYVACVGRLSPSLLALKKRISEIGEIVRFEASLSYDLGRSRSSPAYRSWFFDDDARAVGALYDQGSHLLDALIWLCGFGWKPISCVVNPLELNSEKSLDLSAALTLSRSDGALAQIYVNQGAAFDSVLNLIGSRGTLCARRPFAKGPLQSLRLALGDRETVEYFADYDSQVDLINEIVKATKGQQSVLPLAREGREVINLIEDSYSLLNS